jgi:uncharacterized membrane protein YccC
VGSQSANAATEALRACVRIQRSHVEWVPGVRTAVVITVIMLIATPRDWVDGASAVAIGVLFAAILDTADAPGVRLRSMLWGTLWMSAGVFVGGLVGGWGALHVIAAVLIAAACGYAGALGPRGGLIGVLTLVLFALYAGSIVGLEAAWHNALLTVAGALITIVVNLALVPLRTLAAARTGVSRAYRELESATSRHGLDLAAPAVAAEIMSARGIGRRLGCSGATQAWLGGLLGDAERARLALLALLSEREGSTAYVDGLATQAGAVAGSIASAIARPWGGMARRDLARARDQLAVAARMLADAPGQPVAALGEELLAPLSHAVRALESPWPIGRHAEISHTPALRDPVLPRLRAHAHRGDPVLGHTIRLVIAFGGATLAAVLVGGPHAFWLPLTVAWVAKPDLASTVSRVTMRVAGTIAGLLLTTALLLVVDGRSWTGVVLALSLGVFTALALAYIWANYPIAVIGVTSFVLVLDHLAGDSDTSDLLTRLLATVAGGIWVLLVSSIRPHRTGTGAIARLRLTHAALRRYAGAVRTGVGVDEARAAVLTQRTAALQAVTAASLETPGLWERREARLDPEQAAAVLADVIQAASAVLAEELLARHGESDEALWQGIDDELDDLGARIEALAPGLP